MQPDYVIQLAGQGKDWVDIMAALLTPTIAVVGIVLGWFQWKVNRIRLTHELFEKRWRIFQSASDCLNNVMIEIMNAEDAGLDRMANIPESFHSSTEGARFIFNEELAKYLDNITPYTITAEYKLQSEKEQSVDAFEFWGMKSEELENRVAPFMRLS